MNEDNIQKPHLCKHFICGGFCDTDVRETKILGGGYWVKCCDIFDDPDYLCEQYELKKKDYDQA